MNRHRRELLYFDLHSVTGNHIYSRIRYFPVNTSSTFPVRPKGSAPPSAVTILGGSTLFRFLRHNGERNGSLRNDHSIPEWNSAWGASENSSLPSGRNVNTASAVKRRSHIVNADKTTTTQTHLILILSIVIIIIENHNVLRAEGSRGNRRQNPPVAAMQVQNAGSGLIRLRKLIIRKTVAVGIAGSHHAVKVLPQIGGEGKSTDEMAESYAASRVRPKHHAGG